MKNAELKILLDAMVLRYNQNSFIGPDPISVPHRFTKKQDIEIAGLFASLLAWGQRTTIIKNANRLMDMMDKAPFDFIINHKAIERKKFEKFVHRTFQPEDLLYFLEFLQFHYQNHDSLENLFSDGMTSNDLHVGNGLINFQKQFFALPHLQRTEKHVQTPERNSACKRLNLYLRWMVRKDTQGVDFGVWKNIKMSQLLMPLDVHVHRTAIAMGLLKRKQADWPATLELTAKLRRLDATDPAKYDYALFGLSIEGGKLNK